MKIISSKPAGRKTVYDIGVPVTHNFVLDNGLVSHNCFNKSHSISYSMLTYICAWLKANHPVEFFCGLMTTRSRSLQPKTWKLKAPEYINEARQLGVDIHPPTVNASSIGFTIKDGEIFFGLNAIQDVGSVASKSIVAARGNVPFLDIKDFVTRVNLTKVNAKSFQALVKAGAFDRMGYIRSELLAKTNDIYDYPRNLQDYHERLETNSQREIENVEIQKKIDHKKELQRIKRLKSERELTMKEEEFLEETKGLRLHRLLQVGDKPEFPKLQRQKEISLSVSDLMEQAEYIGCYIGTHPARIIYPQVSSIASAKLNEKQELCGTVSNLKEIKDRNGNKMAFLEFGDGTGIAEAVIFSSTYIKLASVPEVGNLIKVYGEVDSIDPQVKMRLYGLEIYRSNE